MKDMITPLIPLAFEFRKTELWADLGDNDIYAVQLRDGRIGYCSVMGNAGEHYALALHIGGTGWNTYLDICTMSECESNIDMEQIAYRWDCIHCDFAPHYDIRPSKAKDAILAYAKKHRVPTSGTAALPDFVRFHPCFAPFNISEQSDADAMEDALCASIFLAWYMNDKSIEEVGFTDEGIQPSDRPGQEIPFIIPKGKSWEITKTTLPGRTPVNYPSPQFNYPEILMQIIALKSRSNLECRQMILGTPVLDKELPYLPLMILAVDGNDGHAIITEISADSPDLADKLVVDLALKIINMGYRPSRIFVQDDRTQALLRDFCLKTGIAMQRVSRLKHLQDAWESLSNHLSQQKKFDA